MTMRLSSGNDSFHYVSLLKLIDKHPQDLPVMLEQLPDERTHLMAARAVRDAAKQAGVTLHKSK